ncbi:MAG: Lrp/AsnC family transcriptional regulator [Nanoarchaeota archaeon]
MNTKERIFLHYLRLNARAPLTEISKRTSIPVSTLFDRLKTLQEHLILKHTTLLDFEKLGYPCRAAIMLSVPLGHREDLRHYLETHEHVNSIFRINNGYDYFVDCIFTDMQRAEQFIEDLEARFQITDKKTHYIVQVIKNEEFLCNPLSNPQTPTRSLLDIKASL